MQKTTKRERMLPLRYRNRPVFQTRRARYFANTMASKCSNQKWAKLKSNFCTLPFIPEIYIFDKKSKILFSFRNMVSARLGSRLGTVKQGKLRVLTFFGDILYLRVLGIFREIWKFSGIFGAE